MEFSIGWRTVWIQYQQSIYIEKKEVGITLPISEYFSAKDNMKISLANI
jgi:hypothetical protein